MTLRTTLENVPASIVPIDDATHAILSYAKSAEADEIFEQARQEIVTGHGIEPTAEYFADLNRRISERVKNTNKEA